MSKTKIALEIYLLQPLSWFGDLLINCTKPVANLVLNPINRQASMADEWQKRLEFERQQEEALMTWFKSNSKNFNINPKAEAGKKGAEARWGKQSI